MKKGDAIEFEEGEEKRPKRKFRPARIKRRKAR
jgi:hypothetical protein